VKREPQARAGAADRPDAAPPGATGTTPPDTETREPPPDGNAFMLAQIGAHAAARYAQRVARLDLSPAHTGILRLAARQPGLSQQTLSTLLKVLPSKIVSLVDDLENRSLLQRRRSPTDRRNYALQLTDQGHQTMAEIRTIAREHDRDITAALTPDERRQLATLLRKISDQQGLTPGVHPGYGSLHGQAS
jgi:DNA-binding MarR family transcriptional regulator